MVDVKRFSGVMNTDDKPENVLGPQHIDALNLRFYGGQNGLTAENVKGNYIIPKWLTQFKVFFNRDILSKLANKQYMYINFLEGPFLAFILAFLVKYNNIRLFDSSERLPSYRKCNTRTNPI